MNGDPTAWVELERHPRRKTAQDHALLLQSIGIPHGLADDGRGVMLLVRAMDFERARAEVERYDRENTGWPPREEPQELHTAGIVSALFYVTVIVSLHLAQRDHAFGIDWTAAGRADAQAIRDGAWWRAITALTLHGDMAHLAGNAVFGAFFGILLSQVLGAGVAWSFVLVSGAVGNALNAYVQAPDHASVGASTAVFGAIGCLAAHRWRTRGRQKTMKSRRLRWLPLAMGVALLGFLGFPQAVPEPGDPGFGRPAVDVMAHATGFLVGGILGAAYASLRARLVESDLAQGLLGWAALDTIGAAWFLALAAAR